MRHSYLLLSCILLSACGSSGSGSTDTSPTASEPQTSNQTHTEIENTTPSTELEQPVEPSASVSTTDLVASNDFNFESTLTIEVQLQIDALQNKRSFVNICQGKSESEIDYNNCPLKAPLNDGKLTTTLKIGSEIENLYLSVWEYDPNSEPYFATWKQATGNQWSIFF